MKYLARIFFVFALILSFAFGSVPAEAFNTLLPQPDLDVESIYPCDVDSENWDGFWGELFEDEEEFRRAFLSGDDRASGASGEWYLSCALKTGHIKFWMIPFFIRNMLQFLLQLAGLISVLMVLVGAYFYIAGGLTDDKEKGRRIIGFAIGGLVLTVLSWVIVNLVLLVLSA